MAGPHKPHTQPRRLRKMAYAPWILYSLYVLHSLLEHEETRAGFLYALRASRVCVFPIYERTAGTAGLYDSANCQRGAAREAVVHSRAVFVAAEENEERIRFPEEVLLIQLIAAELQHHRLLEGKQAKKYSHLSSTVPRC